MFRAGSVPSSPRGPGAARFASFLAGCLFMLGFAGLPVAAVAQVPAGAQAQPASAPASPASRPVARSAASAARSNGKRVTKPVWTQLTPAQQQALAPLSGTWNTLSDVQKRKWVAMSRNFPRMSGAEQAKLHSRMTEWVALSPQQRTQARLNFGESKRLSPNDKKAKWEAYQALPPEEKRKLAASAAKPPATAAAVRPVPQEKLTKVPRPKRVTKSPRIAAAPGQVDHNTLLPQSGPVPAPAPAQAVPAQAAPAQPVPAQPAAVQPAPAQPN